MGQPNITRILEMSVKSTLLLSMLYFLLAWLTKVIAEDIESADHEVVESTTYNCKIQTNSFDNSNVFL